MEEEQRPRNPGQDSDSEDPDDSAGDSDAMSMQELLDAEESGVRDVKRGSVVEGVIVHAGADEILVDVGLKSEGVIPGREAADIEQEIGRRPRAGDRVLVFVLATETSEGHPLLSYRRAGTERFWRRAAEQVQTGEVVEARVLEVNRGGVVVDFGNRAFVPVSQLVTVQRVGDTEEEQEQLVQQLQGLVGQKLRLKVIEADRRRNRLILSERQANRELRSQRRETLMHELEPGQIRHGRVSNIASFGVFVDLGGADGLVHISELSWSRVKHPSEVVKPGQEVDVFVISVDRDAKKIALSLRRAQDDPWLSIEDRYPLNSVVEGEVIKQAQFGVFVKVEDGVEGLVHNSEIAPSDRRILQEGSVMPFRVISIDMDRRRLRLAPAPEAMVDAGPEADASGSDGAAESESGYADSAEGASDAGDGEPVPAGDETADATR
ncbi:MAG: SSU ribosomal protein S1p [uncultured Chloroflexi bacterium]|uniref:SSU ribosomal protein S1p n=1 Tax=uncultured Chloroflexota bacterium TaxID=166587 RepID=A0A6J4K3C0_9CHLR|nr:MAG: SSU ribosomal protein S1p [uncultured Chloroflexota bacterium]